MDRTGVSARKASNRSPTARHAEVTFSSLSLSHGRRLFSSSAGASAGCWQAGQCQRLTNQSSLVSLHPTPIQKTALFCTFLLFNFSPIFQLTPFAPCADAHVPRAKDELPSSPPFSSPLPLNIGSLNAAIEGLGEHYKLPQWGLR